MRPGCGMCVRFRSLYRSVVLPSGVGREEKAEVLN